MLWLYVINSTRANKLTFSIISYCFFFFVLLLLHFHSSFFFHLCIYFAYFFFLFLSLKCILDAIRAWNDKNYNFYFRCFLILPSESDIKDSNNNRTTINWNWKLCKKKERNGCTLLHECFVKDHQDKAKRRHNRPYCMEMA